MRSRGLKVVAVVTAVVAAAGLVWAAGLVGGPGSAPERTATPELPSGDPRPWVVRYQPPAPADWDAIRPRDRSTPDPAVSPLEEDIGPIERMHWGRVVQPGPDGDRVFVTGWSFGEGTDVDYATVAYHGATGRELWVSRYDGAGGRDMAVAQAVAPDGRRVFVTGESPGSDSGTDYATVAYDAVTGERLWVARYDGDGEEDGARAVAVAPDSGRVFVTGASWRADPERQSSTADYATVAYDAATGEELWVARYDGPGGEDQANSLAVAPDGSRVFVTGESHAPATGTDYATVAYDAASGDELWVARYSGPGAGFDWGFFVGAGSAVYVTGRSQGADGVHEMATVAYEPASGRQLWVQRYAGLVRGDHWGRSIAPSPDGTAVYVTGFGAGTGATDDYATVAYDAVTGEQRWVQHYAGPGRGRDWARSIAVAPDGTAVYVTGFSGGEATGDDYATVAYDAASGDELWVVRYDGPGGAKDRAVYVSVSPDGAWVYVTGDSEGADGRDAFATIAYPAHGPPDDAEASAPRGREVGVMRRREGTGTPTRPSMA